MGSFVFKWEHAASEVYVTGTFDGWKKSEQLDKVGDHFEKSVNLADASKKIYYKFVVDGNWVTDHTAPKEADEEGNENNVLTPERIVTKAPNTTAIMSSAAPGSTTAALAASAPIETKEKSTALPGTFPETPAVEADNAFSVNPLPAAPGGLNPIKLAPGEKVPENLAGGSTTDNVKLDADSYQKSDALPGLAAFSSAAPGSTTAALAADAPIEPKVPAIVKESQEKAHVDAEASGVPEEVREKAAVEDELLEKVKLAPSTSEGTAGKGTEKTEKTVTAGEAAASVAAAATAIGGAVFAGAVYAKNAAAEKAAENLPASVKDKLPLQVQNALGTTATAKEATVEEVSPQVPVEVKESIAAAGKAPEAAANTEAVLEKKAVETELLKEVKTVPAVGHASNPTAVAEKAVKKVEETVGAATPSKPVESPATTSKPVDSPATTEKKKKNRISSFFGKLKSKK